MGFKRPFQLWPFLGISPAIYWRAVDPQLKRYDIGGVSVRCVAKAVALAKSTSTKPKKIINWWASAGVRY
jgi:hypothetical protein